MGQASGKLHVEERAGAATFTADRMMVEIQWGTITRVVNKITGTECLVGGPGAAPDGLATGLVYVVSGTSQGSQRSGVMGEAPVEDGAVSLVPDVTRLDRFAVTMEVDRAAESVSYVCRLPNVAATLRITYGLDRASGDLLVQLQGKGRRTGLAGIRFALGPVFCKNVNIGGTCQADFFITASQSFGKTRGTFPTNPLPVICAMARTTFLTLYCARSFTMDLA